MSASDAPNLATMLTAAGYDVVYKGKWDMTNVWETQQLDGESTQPLIQEMEQTYVFSEWNPPDSGFTVGIPITTEPSAESLATLGGGAPNNDDRFVEGADPRQSVPEQFTGRHGLPDARLRRKRGSLPRDGRQHTG